MKEKEVESVSEYISFIERNFDSDYVLFRGQTEDKKLLPKIARIRHRGNILKCEREMLEQFKRYSKPHLSKIPVSDWEWLSLAQHHGMATRLLDWSINPLAALWFAVHDPGVKNSYGVVWIFDVPEADIIKAGHLSKKSPFDGKRTSVFQPDIMSNRIQSQLGWFTVHKYIDARKKFVPFEKNAMYKSRLVKVKISTSKFGQIRFHLDRLGINRMSLFPDLDGIAKHVEWLKSFEEDEDFGQIKIQ